MLPTQESRDQQDVCSMSHSRTSQISYAVALRSGKPCALWTQSVDHDSYQFAQFYGTLTSGPLQTDGCKSHTLDQISIANLYMLEI